MVHHFRRRGLYRVALYAALLFGIAFVFALRSARAEVRALSLELGRDLVPLSDLLEERARVDVNGEHMWASSGLSNASVADILDRYEAHCRDHGVSGEIWGNTSQEAKAPTKIEPGFELGVFRTEQASEGALLCFTEAGDGVRSSFFERLRAFVDTQDVGKLGRLRYVYVRHDRGKSHVLTMWTDDQLRLDKMSGTTADGSEPGFDSPELPRPIHSRRTMSAAISGTPYGVRGYVSQAPPAEVLASYTEDMKRRGFVATETADEGVRAFMRDGSLVTVGTERTKDGTVIGIAEMGNDPDVE